MRSQHLKLVVLGCGTLIVALACILFLPPRGPLKFSPADLPDAQAGVPYDATITLSGNATPAINFSISEGALPKGLKLEKVENQDVVHITGTPDETGTFKFKLFVYCYGTNVSGQEGDQAYTLTVK